MSDIFEISYAAAQNRICFFTGTGFSKAMSNNAIPSWQELLEVMCAHTENPKEISPILFPEDGNNPLTLEAAAQVLKIELLRCNKNLHNEISEYISAIDLAGEFTQTKAFMSSNPFVVATTNYDKLVEAIAGDADCHSLAPGRPVPRSDARVIVYHIHGSVDSSEHMVVTSDDYFRFLNQSTYFSKKLSTILHENTVVVLGYSLGDTNLNAILNEYRGFSRDHFIGANIFLVSRDVIAPQIKDFYSHCYGIRVIDNIEIEELFKQINENLPEAQTRVNRSVENLRIVLGDHQEKTFTDDFLKIEDSFYEIIASVAALGKSIEDEDIVQLIGELITRKRSLSREDGAWVQYEHLARWLIYLASLLELEGTSVQDTYLNAVLYSMNTMSKDYLVGYSWHAYRGWGSGWSGIIPENRHLIKGFIEPSTVWPDAHTIINR